jgi:hypothetical protein
VDQQQQIGIGDFVEAKPIGIADRIEGHVTKKLLNEDMVISTGTGAYTCHGRHVTLLRKATTSAS